MVLLGAGAIQKNRLGVYEQRAWGRPDFLAGLGRRQEDERDEQDQHQTKHRHALTRWGNRCHD